MQVKVDIREGESMAVAFLHRDRAAAIQAAEHAFTQGISRVFGGLVPEGRKILGLECVGERSFMLKLDEPKPQPPAPVPTQGE